MGKAAASSSSVAIEGWLSALNRMLAMPAFAEFDIDAAAEILHAEGVTFKTEIMASPSCRFVSIADPDGNDLTIHQHGLPGTA